MIIGYARVSTQGQNLDSQQDQLKAAGCERIYSEKASGAKAQRPQLERMMEALRASDVVVITELTRLGRSVKDLFAIIDRLHETGASIRSLRETWLDTTTPQGQLLLTIFAGLAQFERDLMRQRTHEGLEAARARGRNGGRPKTAADKVAVAYTFVIPNLSAIGRGRRGFVLESIAKSFNEYVGQCWEYLCREAVSDNLLFGHLWKEASRWWGTVPSGSDGPKEAREMEFDVVAESTDGKAILVGECKWTNPEVATGLHRQLVGKVSLLPFAKDKEIIPVLFLKQPPKDIDKATDISIIYPEDVIRMAHGENE